MNWIVRIVSVLALAGLTLPVFAQSKTLSGGTGVFTGEDWMRARLGTMVRANRKVKDLERGLIKLFQKTDLDGGGVTARDHELANQIKLAKDRGRELGRLLVRDLDGDGQITRAEVKAIVGPEAKQLIVVRGVRISPTPEQIEQIMKQLLAKAFNDDKNRDGIISFAELQAAATAKIKKRSYFWRSTYKRVPLILDGNSDRTVTLDEYETVMKKVIASVDEDGDGSVSAVEASSFKIKARAARRFERSAFRRSQEARRMGDLVRRCGFPKAGKGVQVQLVGAYTGKAITDVEIGGHDIDISASTVVIEPGDVPLYVVLTSYDALVWQFTGAVHRVRNVVVQSIKGSGKRPSRSGVVGIAKDRVHFSPEASCLRYFSSSAGSQGVRAAGRLRVLIDGAVHKTAGAYGMSRISLPSGKIHMSAPFENAVVPDKKGAGVRLWDALKDYAPGGLVSYKPTEVVAALPVERAEVLPHIAGLAQLLDSGALQVVRSVQAFDLGGGLPKGNGKKRDHPREFRIIRKMRFPPGLSGAHGIKFLLKKGVSLPAGDPGYSCVLSEETGQRVAGGGRC